MNITSCISCGVVLDKDNIYFPAIVKDDGTINTDKAVWNGADFVPVVPCPVCNNPILETE